MRDFPVAKISSSFIERAKYHWNQWAAVPIYGLLILAGFTHACMGISGCQYPEEKASEDIARQFLMTRDVDPEKISCISSYHWYTQKQDTIYCYGSEAAKILVVGCSEGSCRFQ